VKRVDVASLAAASPMRGREPDRFQYELMIEDDEGRRELAVGEDRVPEELRPLLDRVRAHGSG
jgi:Emfourin